MGLGHVFIRITRGCRSVGSGVVILVFLLAGGVSESALAASQPLFSWRVYRAADGLSDSHVATVSVGRQGHVWLTHSDTAPVSWLDGYEVKHLPATGNGNFRLYESSDGEVWTLSAEGLMWLVEGRWRSYPVPEIQREIQSNPIRRVRGLPLLPTAPHRVLVLFPDKLVEYDVRYDSRVVVKQAGDTGLAAFSEMAAARDGGVWISGLRGIAKLAGPNKSGLRGQPWSEAIPETTLSLTNFQWLVEDDDGGVTVVADSVGAKLRCAAYFDGDRWTKYQLLDGKLRQAWPGPDRSLWAQSINGLSRMLPGGTEVSEGEALSGGQIYDIAMEPKGVFWLATSEGLVRCAPSLWQSPPELQRLNISGASVHAIAEDPKRRLWVVTSLGLAVRQNQAWQFFRFPDESEPVFQPTDFMGTLSDGRLVMNATDRALVFDPSTGRFQWLSHPQGRAVRLVGQLSAGVLCCQINYTNQTEHFYQLETYNGTHFNPLWRPPANWNLGYPLVCVLGLANGDLWIGNGHGLGLLRDNKWQRFTRGDGQAPEAAFCLLESRDGKLLCGGAGKIYEFDGRSWSVLHSGFDRVNAIIQARDGTLWVAASDGVFRYFNGTWLLNGLEDGLPSVAAYDIYQDNRGVIWAGTARGLSRFYPDADLDPPRTRITNPNAWNQFYSDEPILLGLSGWDKWNFTTSGRLLFSYRLDNFRWLPFDRENAVSLNDITPGNHRFEARAMDRNGNIDTLAAVFEFSVILPWYLETRLLVIAFCGLTVALLFAGLAVNRHLRLQRSYLEIERTVAQRTRELEAANQALLHSQKMRALGTLAAGIAHDFNSILSIIKGSAQIIEDHPEDQDKIHTRISRIKTVVDQGAGIVRSLLGFSRFTEETMEPAQVNAVVEETLKILGDRFLPGITFQCELAPELPEVPCAQDLLQQMLLNLVMNAADAMSGQGRIILRTKLCHELPRDLVLPPAPADRHLAIIVQDSGCGIAPEIKSRIFEPFFTTKSFSSRHGTGLGLSMVYEFSKGLGYGLHVESQVGVGSSFMILMPVR